MSVRIIKGDIREKLAELPADYFDCIVTSPPYMGLRDYGTATWEGGDPECAHIEKISARNDVTIERLAERSAQYGTGTGPGSKVSGVQFKAVCGKCGARRIDAQIGLEATLDEYLETIVAVCRELRRVLKPSGVFFLVIGDSYAANGASGLGTSSTLRRCGVAYKAHLSIKKTVPAGLKPKDLCLVPERLGILLQQDGWWVRSKIIWAKKNCMPESCTDRPTSAHETIYMLTKSERYYYDSVAVQEYSAQHETAASTETVQGLFEDEENNGVLLSRGSSQRASARDNVQDMHCGENSSLSRDGERGAGEETGWKLATTKGVFLHDGKRKGTSTKGGRVTGREGKGEEIFGEREGEGCNSQGARSSNWEKGEDTKHIDDRGMVGNQKSFRDEMCLLRGGFAATDNGPCDSDQQGWAPYERERGSSLSAVQQHEKGQASTRNLRNVWFLASKPFRGSHFAVFPESLAERCIKAGSSERGCCPACGAPWVRVVEKESFSARPNSGGIRGSQPNHYRGIGAPQRGNMYCETETLGWQPSCKCSAERGLSTGVDMAPIPARILDPFAGSGTTGLVADRLGRDCTLIDLSTEYAEMALSRIKDDSPLFVEVAAE